MGVDFRFKLIFDMRKTTCAKADHKDLNELCVPDDQNVVNMKGAHTPTLRDLLRACLANVCFYV